MFVVFFCILYMYSKLFRYLKYCYYLVGYIKITDANGGKNKGENGMDRNINNNKEYNRDFEFFCTKIKRAMELHFGKNYNVKISEVKKNNGVIYHGLAIMEAAKRSCPTIYLESFFEQYEQGRMLGDIVDSIIKIYEENNIMNDGELDFFADYDRVRDRLQIKLINRKLNDKLLEDVPFREFLDMAIVCFVSVNVDDNVNGSILIHNNHICMWGIRSEQLLEDAISNSQKDNEILFMNIEDMMFNLKEQANCSASEDEDIDEIRKEMNERGKSEMYVLTNKKQYFGASMIVHPGTIEKVREVLMEDFYIIPSSIHELLIIPCSIGCSTMSINNMIQEVNSSMLAKEEILSDHMYMYEHCNNSILICE